MRVNKSKTGGLGLIEDEQGHVCGLWVDCVEALMMTDEFRARLRSFCLSHSLPEDVYSRAAAARYTATRPHADGGYHLMIEVSTALPAHAKLKAKNPPVKKVIAKRPWWKFWKVTG